MPQFSQVQVCKNILYYLKLTSHGILRYLWSAYTLINLLMLFSIDYVINIDLFLVFFLIDWKVWGYPTSLTSWFINFNRNISWSMLNHQPWKVGRSNATCFSENIALIIKKDFDLLIVIALFLFQNILSFFPF